MSGDSLQPTEVLAPDFVQLDRGQRGQGGGVSPLPGGVSLLPGEALPLPGGVLSLPGEVIRLPGEVSPLPGEVIRLPGEVLPLPAPLLGVWGVAGCGQDALHAVPHTGHALARAQHNSGQHHVPGYLDMCVRIPNTQICVQISNFILYLHYVSCCELQLAAWCAALAGVSVS